MNDTLVHAPDFLWGYTCNQKGCCCGPWRVGLSEADVHRLRLTLQGTPLEGALAEALELKRPTPFAKLLPSSAQLSRFGPHLGTLAKGEGGECTFLDEEAQCRVHAEAGEEALPDICRNFPIAGYDTPAGPMAFWDLLCPEVANLLAETRRGAEIVPMPETFERTTYLFRPAHPQSSVALSASREVPFEGYLAFRQQTLAALREGAEAPLLPLASALDQLQSWLNAPDMTSPPSLEAADAEAYGALLDHLARCALAAEGDAERLRTKIPFARRFFRHHSWGTEGVLDLLEAPDWPSVPEALEALSDAQQGTHIVLTNYLIMKLWGVPLVRQGSMEGGLLQLLRRLGAGLYLAGVLAEVRGEALSAAKLVSALTFSDVVYRVKGPAAPRLAPRALARGHTPTGRLDDLSRWTAPTLRGGVAIVDARDSVDPKEEVMAGGFESDAAALEALMVVLRQRGQVALEAHAVGVKAGVRAARSGQVPSASSPWPEASSSTGRASLDAREAFAERLGQSSDEVALARLTRSLGLSSEEVLALGLLLGAQTDIGWARALAHVTLDYGDRAPTLRSLEILLGPHARRIVGRESRLRRLRLVVARGAEGEGESAETRLELPAEVTSALLGGQVAWPLALCAARIHETKVSGWLSPPASLRAALNERVVERPESGTIVALVGPEGLCRLGLLRQSLERPVFGIRVDAEALEKKGADALIYLAIRHAALSGSECLIEIEAKGLSRPETRDALVTAASLWAKPLFLSTELAPSALYGRTSVVEVRVPGASVADRTKALIKSLPQEVMLADASAIQAALTSLAIPPSRIPGAVDRVVGEALIAVGMSGRSSRRARPKVAAEQLRTALREQLSSRIGDYAHAVTPGGSWEDLQLEPDSKARLREVVTAYQHRDQVLNTWGFAGTGAAGNGVTALFYGPPGTGKTMSAGIVAGELGLEVFQIDLSRVVDKYIGETEKALGKVFDEAQRGEVLLLFDEADSLFGKRTEVQSATDRYANLEVNYLLQRIEAYTGIVVLTTNHESLIDPAFRRRLKYQVHFPLPEAAERAGIWRSLIPAEMPLSDDVDYDALGERFEFSGGHVKNAVLTAAILATCDEAQVSMRHLTEGGNREYRSLGKIVREYEDE